jgi:hypothetical protein
MNIVLLEEFGIVPRTKKEKFFSLPCPPEADPPMAEWEGIKGRVTR